MTDDEIISALQSSEKEQDRAWKYIYQKSGWRGMALNYVLGNKGGKSDAKDVFHDALVDFDKNVRNSKFKGESSLVTYFMSILRNKWLSKLRQEGRLKKREDVVAQSNSTNKESPKVEEKDLLDRILDVLGREMKEKCRDILSLFWNGYKMEEIAEKLNIHGGAAAAKRDKFRCNKRFMQLLSERGLVP